MEKNKTCFLDAKKVLIFRPSLKLCAITVSMQAANQLLYGDSGKGGVNPRLAAAIRGDQFTHKGFHFRSLHPDVEITLEDIGELSLEEYDYLCGEKRVYPPARFVKDRNNSKFRSHYKKLKFKDKRNEK